MRLQKRLIFSIVSCIIMFSTLVVHAQGTGSQQQDTEKPSGLIEYVVSGDSANLRSGPGTNFGIVLTARKGDSLLIYPDNPETSGWLRVYLENVEEAYIADFLVERAPVRFYPPSQDPMLTWEGRGKQISDIFDIPRGAYRVDVQVEDNFFILKTVTIEGNCRDKTLLNEGVFRANSLNVSTLFASEGCSILLETDNVDGAWVIEFRDILADEVLVDYTLAIENGTAISGTGTQLTMPTMLEQGIWTINAKVNDNFFILRAEPIGNCDSGSVFNEGSSSASTLEVSTVYRANEDCTVFWLTSNVDEAWEISFNKLR